MDQTLDDSCGTYSCLVWLHWRRALLFSLVPGIGFTFLDLLIGRDGRWMRFGIFVGVLLVFLVIAMFKTWRDERRARRADLLRDLIREARDISERLDKFEETRRNERKAPPSVAVLGDHWLTNIDPSEVDGRDARHRLRIHSERLSRGGIASMPFAKIGERTLVAETKSALADHIEFMSQLIQASGMASPRP